MFLEVVYSPLTFTRPPSNVESPEVVYVPLKLFIPFEKEDAPVTFITPSTVKTVFASLPITVAAFELLTVMPLPILIEAVLPERPVSAGRVRVQPFVRFIAALPPFLTDKSIAIA